FMYPISAAIQNTVPEPSGQAAADVSQHLATASPQLEPLHPAEGTLHRGVIRGTARVQLSTPTITIPQNSTSEVTAHRQIRTDYAIQERCRCRSRCTARSRPRSPSNATRTAPAAGRFSKSRYLMKTARLCSSQRREPD